MEVQIRLSRSHLIVSIVGVIAGLVSVGLAAFSLGRESADNPPEPVTKTVTKTVKIPVEVPAVPSEPTEGAEPPPPAIDSPCVAKPNLQAPYEPNDSRFRPAGPIADSATRTALTETANDIDFYAFCIDSPAQMHVSVSNQTSDCSNLVAMLYDDSGQTIAEQISPSAGETMSFDISVDPGRYALWVNSDYGITCPGARYGFQVKAVPSGALSERLPLDAGPGPGA